MAYNMILFEKLPHYPKDCDIPQPATQGSAGLDLRAADPICLYPGQSCKMPTGLKVALPPGIVGMVFPRSSLGIKGLRLKNTVGIIDSDYRGEIFLFIENGSTVEERIFITPGDRIAQLVPVKIPFMNILEDRVGETERGEGGFGSTGEK